MARSIVGARDGPQSGHSARHLALRLEEQGRLLAGMSREEAAELLWVVTSIQTFGQLTRQRGLTPARAAERLKALVPATRAPRGIMDGHGQ